MNARSDEHAESVGHEVRDEVRDFAKMHVELARSEMRAGSAHFRWGVVCLVAASFLFLFAFVAGGLTLFLFLQARMSSPAAGAIVTSAYIVAACGFLLWGRWSMNGVRALLLPRTRAMLAEIVRWPEGRAAENDGWEKADGSRNR